MITLWSNKICPVGFATINIRDILVVLQSRHFNTINPMPMTAKFLINQPNIFHKKLRIIEYASLIPYHEKDRTKVEN